MMLSELPAIALVCGIGGVGLWASNFAYDRGTPHYLSRKIGHAAGGISFLVSFLLLSSIWAMTLAAAFGAVMYLARRLKPSVFRGVGGTGRSNRARAEIWFVLVALPVSLVAWYWLGKPEVAVTSLLFMAWGDGVTGLIRARVYHQPTKGWWGSVAMFLVCLTLSLIFIRPFWIGAAGAGMAVVAEYACGDVGSVRWADDNLAVPLVSMATMLLLMSLSGNLMLEAP